MEALAKPREKTEKGKRKMQHIKSITYYIRNCYEDVKPAYEQIGLYPNKRLLEYKSPDLLGSIVNFDNALHALLFRQLVDAYGKQDFDGADHHQSFSTELQFEKWARKAHFCDEDVTWEIAFNHDSGRFEKYICCGSAPVPTVLEEITRAIKERYPQLNELQEGDCR